MCKQSILYKEGRCSASPALARNFNGSLHLYSKEFSFMRGVKRYFNFHAKIRPFSAEKFQKDQNGLRGHSRPLEAKSRNNRIYMSNLTIFVGASNRRRPRMICQNAIGLGPGNSREFPEKIISRSFPGIFSISREISGNFYVL